MDLNYMIFAEEHSGDHYWFNAGAINCRLVMTQDSVFRHDAGYHFDTVILEEFLNSKKRLLVYNQTRYIIVARGRIYEP